MRRVFLLFTLFLSCLSRPQYTISVEGSQFKMNPQMEFSGNDALEQCEAMLLYLTFRDPPQWKICNCRPLTP